MRRGTGQGGLDAVGKQYRYLVWNHPAMNPLLRHLAWQVPRPLNLPAMRAAQGAGERCVARIDYHGGEGQDSALLQTSVSGTLEPITPAALRRALWRYPAMTLGVLLHIHTQALRLWLKHLPFFRKPPPPAAFVSR